MRVWCTAAALAASAGCLSETPIALPELGGARAMVVVVAARGQPLAAEAVAVPVTRAIPIGVDRSRAVDVFVFLYDRPLAALDLTDGALELAPRAACGRRLPRPTESWALATDRGAWSSPEPGSLPDVRVALAPGPCPKLDATGALSVDVVCATNSCHARFEQTECRIDIDTVDCPFGVLHGRVGGHGEVCFEPSEALGACEAIAPVETPVGTSALALSCAGGPTACELDLYPPVAAPVFRVDELALAPGGATSDDDVGRPPWGIVLDLAVQDGLVAVVGLDVVGSWYCRGRTGGEVYLVDADTLELVSTATTPECPVAIAADPSGPGFLIAYGADHPALARLDRAGRVTDTVAWTPTAGSAAPHATSLLALGGPSPTAFVAVAQAIRDSPGPSWIFKVDLSTFREVPVPNPSGVSIRQLAPWRANEILALDEPWDGVRIVDVETGLSRNGPSLATTVARVNPGQAFWHPQSARFVLSEAGLNGGVFTFRETFERSGRASLYERAAGVWAITPWPADPRLVLVGMTDQAAGARTAAIALMDPAVPRFLPGAQALGVGAIGALRPDGHGRVFTVLTWTGKLLRISSDR